MTRLGIVGAEAKKFTPHTQEVARHVIRRLCEILDVDLVISGRSPLGGIDWWAIEEADKANIKTLELPPEIFRWEGGFKQRNLEIARLSNSVVCIAVKQLPPGFKGRQFPQGCYHCGTPPEHHVKSGGCWTAKQAARLGKPASLIVIDETDRVGETLLDTAGFSGSVPRIGTSPAFFNLSGEME